MYDLGDRMVSAVLCVYRMGFDHDEAGVKVTPSYLYTDTIWRQEPLNERLKKERNSAYWNIKLVFLRSLHSFAICCATWEIVQKYYLVKYRHRSCEVRCIMHSRQHRGGFFRINVWRIIYAKEQNWPQERTLGHFGRHIDYRQIWGIQQNIVT